MFNCPQCLFIKLVFEEPIQSNFGINIQEMMPHFDTTFWNLMTIH